MDKINAHIGRRIRSLRTGRNLTLDKLSELAKITTKHLGKVERGEVNPSIQCLMSIATALELPVSSILDAGHEQTREELINEIVSLSPKLSLKDAQIVYRLVAMLTNH